MMNTKKTGMKGMQGILKSLLSLISLFIDLELQMVKKLVFLLAVLGLGWACAFPLELVSQATPDALIDRAAAAPLTPTDVPDILVPLTPTPDALVDRAAPSPTSTAAPSPSATLAPRATLAPLPTRTPAPSRTPLPAATATPEGFYFFREGGFTFTLPYTWEVTGKSPARLNLFDSNGVLVELSHRTQIPGQTLEQLVDVFRQNATDTIWVQTGRSLIKVGGQPALQVDLLARATRGRLALRLVVLNANGASYQFTFAGSDLTNRLPGINRFLGSVQFVDPLVVSSMLRQALTQAGSSPLERDLDPATALTSMADADYIGLLYSGLVRLDPELQIEPDLAQRWEISPDGLVYTFTLRPNLKFASGLSLSAGDVIASWDRACSPKTGSTTARRVLGDIQGARARLDGEASQVSGLRLINDSTLEVTLAEPSPTFLAKLAEPAAAVVNRMSVMTYTSSWVYTSDASGPYVLDERVPGRRMVFQRNPYYYNPPDIPTRVFLLNPDDTPLALYEKNQLDLVSLTGREWQRISGGESELKGQLQGGIDLCTVMLRLNTSLPPFDDPDVRRAFALATDRRGYNERILSGAGLPAAGILPPAMPGFDAARAAFPYDPDAARRLLEGSKYAGSLPPVRLGVSGSTAPARVEWLADQWLKNLGVKVQVELLDPQNPIRAAFLSDAQLLDLTWCAGYPDPAGVLDVLFHSQSDLNMAHTRDPWLDTLLEQARVEYDPAQRLDLYRQVEDRLLESGSVIPLVHPARYTLVKPWVLGYRFAPAPVLQAPYLGLGR